GDWTTGGVGGILSVAPDLACRSSEQTYEQFLAWFTRLTPGQFSRVGIICVNKHLHGLAPGSLLPAVFLAGPGGGEEAAQQRGRQGRLGLPADQVEVAGLWISVSHPSMPSHMVLPGQVGEEVPAITPSCHHIQLELSSSARGQGQITSDDQATTTPRVENRDVVLPSLEHALYRSSSGQL
uniref:Uncharacterized protein n=1 Tax=Denticeps clupeoides TaxID=299321 RepID=A0AAY4B5A4_9TELE